MRGIAVIGLGGFPCFGVKDVINHMVNLLYVSETIRCSAIAFGVLSVILTATQALCHIESKIEHAHLDYIKYIIHFVILPLQESSHVILSAIKLLVYEQRIKEVASKK